MQKVVLGLLLIFLVFGISTAPSLLAEDDNSSGSNSGSDSVTSVRDSDRDNNEDEDNERERTEVRIRERERNGEIESEFKGEIRTVGGERVKIERKIRIKDGEVEIKTKLKIEGEGANLVVVDSEGNRNMIRVTPERLRILIEERLEATNITDFSLEEVEHKNIPRVVFKVNSEHPGRFLGILKIALRAEIQVDPETGEIIDVNVPWWAFLITGDEISNTDEIVGNEALEDDLVAGGDAELEEEFGEVEIEEEFEVSGTKVEISGDIEISEEAQATLDSLVASFENVQDKVELKLKVKKQNDRVSVESEIKAGVLTSEQLGLWNALMTQVRGLVSDAAGDDIEIEIEIEHEHELEDEEKLEEVSATEAQESIREAREEIAEAENALSRALAINPNGDFSAAETKIADAKEKISEAEALLTESDFKAVIDKAEDAEQLAEDALDAVEDILEDRLSGRAIENITR